MVSSTPVSLEPKSHRRVEAYSIATDIKPENILVTFEDPSVLLEFVKRHSAQPVPRKVGEIRTVYQSLNDFGEPRSLRVLPMISDLGLAQWNHPSHEGITPIQTDPYRAPEAILGAGWTYRTDIWNLGLMVCFLVLYTYKALILIIFLTKQIWELLENKHLFTIAHSSDGKYNAKTHLAEMIALFGPPPGDLLRREREGRQFRWGTPQANDKGSLCDRAIEFFEGPFFDSKGWLSYRKRSFSTHVVS